MPKSKSEVASLKELNKARKQMLDREPDPFKQETIKGWIRETEARIEMHKHGKAS
jgi:hypothetical protein